MEPYAHAVDPGVHALWQLHLRRNELQCTYLERWNECEDLDGLLSMFLITFPFSSSSPTAELIVLAPVCPFAAVEHTKYRHVGYTCVFNILDYACLSFPCNVAADKTVDVPRAEDQKRPLSETDELIRKECMFFPHTYIHTYIHLSHVSLPFCSVCAC